MFLAFFIFLKFLFNNTGSLTKSQPALSKSEWQKKLTPEQFHVTREKGTEAVSYTCLRFLSRCVGCGAGQTGVDLTTKPNLVLFSQITPPSPSHSKRTASGSLTYEAVHPKPVLWDSLEGCGECKGGSGEREHMYAYGRCMLMYGKSHQDIIRELPSN